MKAFPLLCVALVLSATVMVDARSVLAKGQGGQGQGQGQGGQGAGTPPASAHDFRELRRDCALEAQALEEEAGCRYMPVGTSCNSGAGTCQYVDMTEPLDDGRSCMNVLHPVKGTVYNKQFKDCM